MDETVSNEPELDEEQLLTAVMRAEALERSTEDLSWMYEFDDSCWELDDGSYDEFNDIPDIYPFDRRL